MIFKMFNQWRIKRTPEYKRQRKADIEKGSNLLAQLEVTSVQIDVHMEYGERDKYIALLGEYSELLNELGKHIRYLRDKGEDDLSKWLVRMAAVHSVKSGFLSLLRRKYGLETK